MLYPWANFDGVHYLSIAESGYQDNERFLPAFPLLIRFFVSLFGGGEPYSAIYFFTAIGIVHLLFLVSLVLLYKLIRMDFSEKIAFASVIFLLLFPTSFFFVSIYSESLFLFLTLLSFYCAYKRQWLGAGIAGMFMSATRIVGVSILPAMLYEYYIQSLRGAQRRSNPAEIATSPAKRGTRNDKNVIPLLFVPLGVFGYAIFNFFTRGDALYFLKAHESLGNSRELGVVLFPQTVFRYVKILTALPYSQFEWWIALLELSTFVIVALLLYIGWKKNIRTSYLIFSLLCFFIPASSGTFTALPRYVAIIFPLFITLALVKNKSVQIAYMAIAVPIFFVLLMFFSRGYFVA